MKKFFLAGTLLFFMLTVSTAFAQTVGGTVTDSSKALLPGVTVTLTNTETGVVQTQLSNESGVYRFASVPFGSQYAINASLPGFKTFVQRDIAVGLNASVQVNITMEVGEIASTVDVTATRSTTLLEQGPSIGDVLTQERIQSMPLVGQNVLDLLEILPGIRISGAGSQYDRISGLGIDEINVTRDGITVSDSRFQAGQTSAFQTDSSGNFILCPTGGFALNNAIDTNRPCSTSYAGSIRQLSTTFLNPDLVGEIKLILSPVDAELGRGNSQVQIQTRSGTNRYSGSASWNIRNTALNANSWGNNNDTVGGVWTPTKPDWRNTHNYTLSYGGPIVRNKTFFFVSWDQNISNTRDSQTVTVLTDTARQGIFRYWEGWNPQSANSANNGAGLTGANPSVRSIDDLGNPLNPYLAATGNTPVWANQTPYTGRLVCFSIFGNLKMDGSPFTSADCPGGTDSRGNPYTAVAAFPPANGLWDAKRPINNPSGYIAKVLQLMPRANYFSQGGMGAPDGLNSASFRWVRGRKGNATNEAVVGSSAFTNRKQINIKIDQNFRSHRISGNWSYQMDDSTDNVAAWPDGYSGVSSRRPQTVTINATSTISSTLLNEARFGVNINKTKSVPAWFVDDEQYASEARSFLGDGGTRNGVPYSVAVDPSFFGSNGYMPAGTGQVTNLSYNNPSYTFADTLSWTRGVHSFRFGADVRVPTSDGYATQTYPVATYGNLGGGTTTSPFSQNSQAANSAGSPQYINELGCFAQNTTTAPCNVINGQSIPIFGTTVRGNAVNLAYLLTDSIGSIQNFYWIDDHSDVENGFWEDVTTKGEKLRSIKSVEYAFFAKDDWRIRRDLTLNLGLRYEYYSPAYLQSGLTSAVVDYGEGLFGANRSAASGGDLFNTWLHPGNLYLAGYGSAGGGLRCELGTANPNGLPASTCDPSLMTGIEFVGPNSPNPDQTVLPRDRNNFGPAIGFSWQVPWFGEGKTTIRGGYSVQFSRTNVSENTLVSALGNSSEPIGGSTGYTSAVQAISANRAINYGDLPTLVPANVPTVPPGQAVPIYARSASVTAYAPDFATPYTQNLNLSVTRSLTRNLTLDVRYVGTLSRKTQGTLNLNTNTVLYNPELFSALEAARRGENPKLLDDMLMGLRLTGVSTSYGTTTGMVNGVNAFGGGQLRMSTATRTNLANGDFVSVANTLMSNPNAFGSTLAGTAGLQTAGQPNNAAGVLVRNGCNRIANGVTSVGTGAATVNNVQTRCFAENYLISNPQLNGASYLANLGHQNYHSLQTQISLRPVQGMSFQGTWSWAKSLGTPGSGFTDPLNRDADYSQGGGNFVTSEPRHTFRMNGTFELPVGPNKLFFGNSSGWVARLIERWSTSIILNMQTGTPFSITGAETMRYANGRYVATPLWQIPEGQSPKFTGGANGQNAFYYGNTFFSARDPQCSDLGYVTQTADPVSAGTAPLPLGSLCTLEGLSTAQGMVLVNPHPGEYGTLGTGNMEGLGSWTLNANIGKTFRLSESRQLTVRVDATNILNHPAPNPPSFDATEAAFFGGPPTLFGQISGKGGTPRNLQASLRLTF
jgi:hypothetical protein